MRIGAPPFRHQPSRVLTFFPATERCALGGEFRMFRGFVALALAGLFLACASVCAAAPPVEAYARLPAMENVSLSPSGARYAYIIVDGDARKLVVATVDGNQALFASDVGKAK